MQRILGLRVRSLSNNSVITIEELEREFNSRVEISIFDDHTIVVELEHRVPYFLDQLALAVCSPVYKPSVEGWDVASGEYARAVDDGWQNTKPPPMNQRKWVSIDKSTGKIKQKYFWARPGSLVSNGPFYLEGWRYKKRYENGEKPLLPLSRNHNTKFNSSNYDFGPKHRRACV